MTEPNDRELEQYLKGDSPLSRRYRDAGAETTPPDLDEAILARARAEARRKPSINRVLAPVALAASLVLAVNLGWNVYQATPPPGELPELADAKSRDEGFAPEPPVAPAPVARADAPAAPAEPAPVPERKARVATREPALQEKLAAQEENDAGMAAQRQEQESLRKAESEERMAMARRAPAEAAPPEPQASGGVSSAAPSAPSAMMAMDAAAPMPEGGKIDHLINFIGDLRGATFIRNGKEYGPAEAAKHLQLKREKAGDRVKTAGDFIRLCASHSYLSGEAYLIRFADGRTRTAEDVLREELARIEGR